MIGRLILLGVLIVSLSTAVGWTLDDGSPPLALPESIPDATATPVA